MSAGVSFADLQRHLALFGQGFAGEPVNLDVLPEETEEPKVSPDRLWLPDRMADFDSVPDNEASFRIAVLRQVAYRTEGAMAVLSAHRLLQARDSALREIFLWLEAARLDALLARRYPGARRPLDRVRAKSRAALEAPLAQGLAAAGLVTLRRLAAGAAPEVLCRGPHAEVLRLIAREVARLEQDAASALDSLKSALAVQRALGLSQLPVPAVLADDGRETADLGTASVPLPPLPGQGNAQADETALYIPPDEAVAGTATEQRWPATARQPTAGKAGATRLPPAAQRPLFALPQEDAPAHARAYFYDEWDYQAGVYLRHFCRLFEQRLEPVDTDLWSQARRRHGRLFREVRHQFARIRPEAWLRVHATSDGDELELDRLIEAVADRRAGFSGDGRLYRRYERGRRDVAAAFLLDMSASTDIAVNSAAVPLPAVPPREPGLYSPSHEEPAARAEPAPKRCVLDVEKDAMVLMGQALEMLGDSFAIFGFSGDGRRHVEFNVAKDFKDRVSSRTWAALAAMRPRRSTRMGAAIRHALAKLARESAAMKVLIIVSDGYPEDSDYGPDRGSYEYGIQDTAQALKEAAGLGITDFCVTVDPSGHDYLKRMCTPSRYLVIDDVAALPSELTKVYKTLTA